MVSGFKSVKFTIENVNDEKKIKRKLIKCTDPKKLDN